MTKDEIIIAFFTVIYGLMLAELFKNVHKVIKARKFIKWDWLSPLFSWFLFLALLFNWWNITIGKISNDFNIIHFVIQGHVMFLIYLLVSAVLPDEIHKKGIDLKAYYYDNYKYFWILLVAIALISKSTFFIRTISDSSEIELSRIFYEVFFTLICFIPIIIKKYWIHLAILALFNLSIVISLVKHIQA